MTPVHNVEPSWRIDLRVQHGPASASTLVVSSALISSRVYAAPWPSIPLVAYLLAPPVLVGRGVLCSRAVTFVLMWKAYLLKCCPWLG